MAQTSSGEKIWEKVTAARGEVSLRSALHEWLLRTPIDPVGGSDRGATADRFLEAYLSGYERSLHATLTAIMGNSEPDKLQSRLEEGVAQVRSFLRAEDKAEADRARTRLVRAGILFIESYRDLPLLAWPRLLLETVVVLEERVLLWRTRHVRMVERIIGQRIGTGGTSGAGFLEQRNKGRIFPELWQVRTILLSRKFLPDLKRPEFYAFEDSRLS
jgi:tryptophan 2,3-dioxygenase